MPMVIHGLNYVKFQSFALESNWVVLLIQDPCWMKKILLVMLYFGFPDHSLSQSLSQLQYQSFQSEFD